MVRRNSVQRILVAFVAVAAFFGVQQASAQLIYVGGGATLPTGDFGDFAKTGWQAVGGFLYPVGPEGLAIGVEGFYGQNKHKDEAALTSDDKTSPYGAMAIVDYGVQTNANLVPYFFGGVGVMVHRFSTTGASESETQFGYEAGAGIEFTVAPKIGIFLEGRYMGSKDTQFVSALAGVAFSLAGS